MHILVVDDDIPTVEVIRTSLHWDLLGIDRVETAYDYTCLLYTSDAADEL